MMPEVPELLVDLKPRRSEALVGEVVLRVQEPVHGTWDLLAAVVRDAFRSVGKAQPLIRAFRDGRGADGSTDGLAFLEAHLSDLGGLADVLVELLGSRLRQVVVAILDTRENRRRYREWLLAQGPDASAGEDAAYPAKLSEYVVESITMRQETELLAKTIEACDVRDVLGKFKRLAAVATAAFRQASGESPAASAA